MKRGGKKWIATTLFWIGVFILFPDMGWLQRFAGGVCMSIGIMLEVSD